MSRRQDREGVPRHELQLRRNLSCEPESHVNERGWYVPHLAWEGWEEFNRADYALHCVLIWRRMNVPPPGPLFREDGTLDRCQLGRGSTLARIESDLRSFHFHIAQSQQCARPALP